MSETEPPPRASIAPSAQLCGWAMVAAVNALFISRLSMPPGGWTLRAAHHAFDAAMTLAMGLGVSAACEAWRRWGPRRARWGYAAVALASAAAGIVVLEEDLWGLAVDLAGDAAGSLVVALSLAAALSVPAAAVAGAWLARPRLRWLGAGAGVALAAANNLLLQKGYPGLHLLAAFVAATSFGTALGNGAVWDRLDAAGPRLARRLTVARACLALGAAAALVVTPAQATLIELYRLDGQVVAPYVSALHEALEPEPEPPATSTEVGDWFADRSQLAPIAPTAPRLVPDDAIVILFTVDSLLARVVRDDRYREALPVLFGLRDGALDFTQARAPASGTTTTLASLFLCKYLSQMSWSSSRGMKRPTPHADASPRLPDLLAAAGIKSVHFVSYRPLEARFGIGRGFSEEVFPKADQGQRFPLSHNIVPAMIDRLKRHRRGPLFLYAHLMDPHHPHDAATTEGELFDRYVAEIGLVDRWIGELQRAIAALGLEARTVLIVTADHGEGFGMHGTPHHNVNLYEELIHVPLLIQLPGVAARRFDVPVTLLDLPPTILDLWSLPTPPSCMGQTLVPLMRGAPPAFTRPIAAEIPGKQAMFFGRTKLIRSVGRQRAVELYDLDRDPEETDNRFDQSGDEGRRQLARLVEFFAVHALDKRDR